MNEERGPCAACQARYALTRQKKLRIMGDQPKHLSLCYASLVEAMASVVLIFGAQVRRGLISLTMRGTSGGARKS